MNNIPSPEYYTPTVKDADLVQTVIDLAYLEKIEKSRPANAHLFRTITEATYDTKNVLKNTDQNSILLLTDNFASICALPCQEKQIAGFTSGHYNADEQIYEIDYFITVKSPYSSEIDLLNYSAQQAKANGAKTIRVEVSEEGYTTEFKKLGFVYCVDTNGALDEQNMELSAEKIDQILNNGGQITVSGNSNGLTQKNSPQPAS